MKILIVDDEEIISHSLKHLLRYRGYREVSSCSNGKDAVQMIKENDFDVVLLDILMPGIDGLQVLEKTKPFKPDTEFIILTAVDEVSIAVRAIQLGAYDYQVKPVENERLLLSLERAYEHKGLLSGFNPNRGESGESQDAFSTIITQSPLMKSAIRYARVMARSDNPFLITGESGTGKELLARAIHQAGPFADGPFIAVNVSSIPETLFESQFFGHVKGAFTGATNDHPGYFEQADHGTLFLDEIGELPWNLQTKLLRVLEEKEIVRLGQAESRSVNVRIISATNKELEKACQEGKFRLDFLYRLKSAHAHLPSLKEREGDIPILAHHFLKEACRRHHKKIDDFRPDTLEILCKRTYPGNIRELNHLVENAVLLANSPFIGPEHLDGKVQTNSPFARVLCSLQQDADIQVAYVLNQVGDNRKKAADILGISIRQLQRKISVIKKHPYYKTLIDDI